MVIRQYPYNLYVLKTFASVQDYEGNWSTPESLWILTTKCRNQNNQGKTIILPDGTMFAYSCQIFMPLGTEVLNNSVIEVRELNDKVRFHGVVKLFVKEQQNMKIWA